MIATKNKAAAPRPAAEKKQGAVERTTVERVSRQAAEQARKPVKAVEAEQAKAVASKPAAVKGAVASSAPQKSAGAAQPSAAEVSAKASQAKAAAPAKSSPKAAQPKPAVAAKPAPAESKPAEAAKTARKPSGKPVPASEKQGEQAPAAKKSSSQRQGFKTQEYIVYPAHGVGQILAIEEQEVAGYKLELFVISFAKDKMTLRVPITKVDAVGMRKLAEPAMVKRALDTLKGRARIKRTMWSRRAQEYEAKINSGDIVAIAEVVRDLFRSDSQPEQSYSERQLYEAALDRLAREIAAVERVTETEAIKQIEGALAKGPRRGPKNADSAADGEGEDESFVADEAA